MARTLIDSDILIDHIRGHRRFTKGSDEIHISSITHAELFAGRAQDERRVRQLLVAIAELPVDRAIAERAGRLRRRGRLDMPDALIAATALEHRLTLVTRNMRDFEGVPGLKVRPPADVVQAG